MPKLHFEISIQNVIDDVIANKCKVCKFILFLHNGQNCPKKKWKKNYEGTKLSKKLAFIITIIDTKWIKLSKNGESPETKEKVDKIVQKRGKSRNETKSGQNCPKTGKMAELSIPY